MFQSISAPFFQDYRDKTNILNNGIKALTLQQQELDKEKSEFLLIKTHHIEMEKLEKMKEDLQLKKIKLQKGELN